MNTTVLIAGAGPTGLSMAEALTRRGIPCRIIDRGAGPTRLSRALAVQARTLESFPAEITERLVAAGQRIERAELFEGDRHLARVELSGAPTPFPFALGLSQAKIEQILVERLAELGGRVEWNTCLEDVSSNDADGVEVETSRDGIRVRTRADWVVGCDGVRSPTREAAQISIDRQRGAHWFLMGDVRFEEDAMPHDAGRVFLGDAGVLAMLPLERRGWWRTIAVGDARAQKPQVDRATIESLIAERSPLRLTIAEDDWYSAFRVREHVAQSYRQGRIFLAGDAAHAHSPLGGQGMNTGIQDAHNLAWKLALAARGASERLLDSYEAERRPVAEDLVFATGRGTSALYLSHPWAVWLRNRLLAGLVDSEAFGAQLRRSLEMLDIAYRDSPIVDDYVAPASQSLLRRLRNSGAIGPGERAPLHVPALANVLDGDQFTALVIAGHEVDEGAAAQLGRVTASLGGMDHLGAVPVVGDRRLLAGRPGSLTAARQILDDPDGRIRRIFGVEDCGLVVVRPDGYVGWRGEPFDLLEFGRWWSETTGLPAPTVPT